MTECITTNLLVSLAVALLGVLTAWLRRRQAVRPRYDYQSRPGRLSRKAWRLERWN